LEASVDETVRDAYRRLWGEPAREAVFERAGHKIRVFKWTPESSQEGVFLYATLGASDRSITDEAHRVEYLMGLMPERDYVASHLASLALYAHEFDTSLGHGHTVPGEEALWPGTAMHHLLVVRQAHSIIEPVPVTKSTHVEFMQVIPIFEEEVRFNAEHGIEALLSYWSNQEVPFWDSNRMHPSVPHL
jgi:hypothetical protein